jgi:hypothetical protein
VYEGDFFWVPNFSQRSRNEVEILENIIPDFKGGNLEASLRTASGVLPMDSAHNSPLFRNYLDPVFSFEFSIFYERYRKLAKTFLM